MSRNEQPIFTREPLIGQGEISVANANRDGTGTIVTIVTPGTQGCRIDQIEVKAEGTTTGGMVRLFLSFDSGATWNLWREVPVTAVTPSATVAAFRDVVQLTTALNDEPLNMPDDTVRLGAATENAETFNVYARGGQLAA